MRKYLLIFFLILVLIFTALLAGAGYFVGDYFVNFTLKRGNDMNPHGPPQAYSTILGVKKAPEVDKPNYVSEDWQMTSQDGLKLQATYFEPRKTATIAGLFWYTAMAVTKPMYGIWPELICTMVTKFLPRI